jgi:MerR family copper efflux transcriptional regulator
MDNQLTVGALAKRVGIRASAVRFYERRGLVASQRRANGYRIYDLETVEVLRFINRAKALGFSLEEVREILTLRRGGIEPCDCVTATIERNLVAIEQRIAELSALRRQLYALVKNSRRERRAEEICPILSDAGPRRAMPRRRRQS